jgi:hypothetical protein
MIVGVCGFGFSGSGAVLDLLKDYKDVCVADKVELSFIYKPDGIEDLRRAVSLEPSRYFSSDSAIRRFIKYMNHQKDRYNYISDGKFEQLYQKFLNEVIQIMWYGNTTVHAYQDTGMGYFFKQKLARAFRIRFERGLKKINNPCWPDKKMYYSYMDDSAFMDCARTFIQEFIEAIVGKSNTRIIAIDQAFCANNVKKEFQYFDDCKAIVVFRDPRDIYTLAKTSLGMQGRFIPSDDVDTFIKYYKGLMKSLRYAASEEALYINFEDLVYNYALTVNKIESFLGLTNSEHTGKSKFNPDISINNTQLALKHTYMQSDISKIEEELSDYLYDFTRFKKIPTFKTESF